MDMSSAMGMHMPPHMAAYGLDAAAAVAASGMAAHHGHMAGGWGVPAHHHAAPPGGGGMMGYMHAMPGGMPVAGHHAAAPPTAADLRAQGLRPATGTVCFKLLLTNEQAGAMIGKAGAKIVALQEMHSVFMKLGGAEDVFPGTFHRAALIRGFPSSIRACLLDVVDILWQDYANRKEVEHARMTGAAHMQGAYGMEGMPGAEGGMDAGGAPAASHRSGGSGTGGANYSDFIVRLLVPDNASGAVIGRGGKIVRALAEETGAHVKLASAEGKLPGVQERPILVSGVQGNVSAAVVRIFDIMASEARNLVYANSGVSYPHVPPYMADAAVPSAQGASGQPTYMPASAYAEHVAPGGGMYTPAGMPAGVFGGAPQRERGGWAPRDASSVEYGGISAPAVATSHGGYALPPHGTPTAGGPALGVMYGPGGVPAYAYDRAGGMVSMRMAAAPGYMAAPHLAQAGAHAGGMYFSSAAPGMHEYAGMMHAPPPPHAALYADGNLRPDSGLHPVSSGSAGPMPPPPTGMGTGTAPGSARGPPRDGYAQSTATPSSSLSAASPEWSTAVHQRASASSADGSTLQAPTVQQVSAQAQSQVPAQAQRPAAMSIPDDVGTASPTVRGVHSAPRSSTSSPIVDRQHGVPRVGGGRVSHDMSPHEVGGGGMYAASSARSAGSSSGGAGGAGSGGSNSPSLSAELYNMRLSGHAGGVDGGATLLSSVTSAASMASANTASASDAAGTARSVGSAGYASPALSTYRQEPSASEEGDAYNALVRMQRAFHSSRSLGMLESVVEGDGSGAAGSLFALAPDARMPSGAPHTPGGRKFAPPPLARGMSDSVLLRAPGSGMHGVGISDASALGGGSAGGAHSGAMPAEWLSSRLSTWYPGGMPGKLNAPAAAPSGGGIALVTGGLLPSRMDSLINERSPQRSRMASVIEAGHGVDAEVDVEA